MSTGEHGIKIQARLFTELVISLTEVIVMLNLDVHFN